MTKTHKLPNLRKLHEFTLRLQKGDWRVREHLGLSHTRCFGTQYCEIAIKRYAHRFLLTSQGKLWKKHTLIFLKSLPWLIEIHGPKIYFYRKVFLSQYCVRKCLVWIRPKRTGMTGDWRARATKTFGRVARLNKKYDNLKLYFKNYRKISLFCKK